MITDAVLMWLSDFFVGLIGTLPDFNSPAWLTDTLPDGIQTVGQYASKMGPWIPYDAVGLVLATVAAIVGIALAIRLVRIVASFLTLGGGSAG